MKSRFSIIALVAILFLAAIPASSQLNMQEESSKSMFMEINGLTTENFKTLYQALENNSPFIMAGSCIPAHVVGFRLRSGALPTEQSVVSLQSFLKTNGLPANKPLKNFTYDDFENRCLAARSGK